MLPCNPNKVSAICNLSGCICVPVFLAVTPISLFPHTVTQICNLSGDICVPVLPVLPAVTFVTLLPKHSHWNLQFKWTYWSPCVTCDNPRYLVIQTKTCKFAILVHLFVSLCYLRLPVLPSYPNAVTKIFNLIWCICIPVLPATTHVTLSLKQSSVNLQFMLRYLCPCVTCGYPCYPVTQTQFSKFAI